MNREERARIFHQLDNLQRLARNLETRSPGWFPVDNSRVASDKSEYIAMKERSDILWENAVEAGIIIFELCRIGAFEDQPRIKTVVCEIRSELKKHLQEFTVPYSHLVLNIPYNMRTGRSYDVFFVKLFEGVCNVWIKTQEDRRAFEKYYDALKLKAQLHAKVMRGLAEQLKLHFGNTGKLQDQISD